MSTFRFLSIDYGESYVGLAVSNGFLSIPLKVFAYRKNDLPALANHLLKIVSDNSIQTVVVGKPLNRQLAFKIEHIFSNNSQFGIFRDKGVEVFFISEDRTTKEALLLLKKKRKKRREDSVAASIILDRFFNPKTIGETDDYEY